MSGQCEVEQRARRLIFNSAPTTLSWAQTWTEAFFPSVSTHRGLFLQSALNYSPREGSTQAGGLAGGVGCGQERETGRESRADVGQTPPRSPESSQGLLGGQGGPPSVALRRGTQGGGSLLHSRLPPPRRMLHDTSATEKGSGVKQRAGLLTQQRQSPVPSCGFPAPPALSAADDTHTLRERKPWCGRELQLCPRTKLFTKPQFV